MIRMTITVDKAGHMVIETSGPIAGKEGMLTLLAAARTLVEKMEQPS